MRVVSEAEFSRTMRSLLVDDAELDSITHVTGPGRSGAIAAVYASHLLGVQFIPYGELLPRGVGSLLIIDTARKSGATLRKAMRLYSDHDATVRVAYEEPPRVTFWYETEDGWVWPRKRRRYLEHV